MNALHVAGLSTIDANPKMVSATPDRADTRFVTGKEYVAEVLSCSKDNVVTLRVANTVLEGSFGRSFMPGQTLVLKCVNAQLLPLFEIVRPVLPEAVFDDVSLSKTGTLIEAYLGKVEPTSENNRLAAISTALTNRQLDPKSIAGALERSVVLSGLFYESHQASYALGKRSLEQLMFEPQNQLGFIPSEMIVKQLNTLDQNGFKWVGLVWPGQEMQWAVSFLPQHREEQGQDLDSSITTGASGPEISSRLELELPNLKKIVANLSWHAETLAIELEVNDERAQSILSERLALFLDAMQASGQVVKSCTVQLHEHG
jgi:hypothetical protein